ncbi:MAG: HAD-IA family hydrolase [Ilumatobacteraceae bacterium]
MSELPIKAVLWDFGGVILSSPFEAFNRYEAERGLPENLIRRVNATYPDSNAWAKLERNDISPAEFDLLFAEESEALGHRVPGADVLALLAGDVRPHMVAALNTVIDAGFQTACLTNNVVTTSPSPTDRQREIAEIMASFHHVVESSKVGCRKPEPRFYEIACDLLNVSPKECVFLDDLGINLKPAAAMGMRTIKVVDSHDALRELSQHLSLELL